MSMVAGTVALALAGAGAGLSGLDAAVAAYDKAQVDGDGAALKRLLADDYALVNSAGSVETKAEFIADSTASGFKVEPFRVVKPIERKWKSGAVMGGLARLTVHDRGKTSSACLRFADVWSLRGGHWLVAYTQVAKAKEQDCG